MVHMRLDQVQFSKAGPESTAQYFDEPLLRDWALGVCGQTGGLLTFHCRVLGNSSEELGSGARLAHQFAEHVVCASSNPPPKVMPVGGRGSKLPHVLRAMREGEWRGRGRGGGRSLGPSSGRG